MKRDSLKLQFTDWASLDVLAAETGSLYSGKPSWRRLVKRIARGEFKLVAVVQRPAESIPAPNSVPVEKRFPRNWACPCGVVEKIQEVLRSGIRKMNSLTPNIEHLAGREVAIVCNERGLWLLAANGCRTDLTGCSVTEAVQLCQKRSVTVLRVQKHFGHAR